MAPHNGIASATLAGWLVQTIKAAYPEHGAPGVDPKAHDLRGVSATWAKFNHATVDEIISAAAWKTPSTFTACYIKDLNMAESRFGCKVMSSAASTSRAASD